MDQQSSENPLKEGLNAQSQQQQTAEGIRSGDFAQDKQEPKKKSKKLLLVIILLVVLVWGGVAVVVMLLNKDSNTDANIATNGQDDDDEETVKEDSYEGWETCSSAVLRVNFKVPADWNCEIDEGEGTTGAWIKASSDVFEVNLSDFGREAPYCGEVIQDAEDSGVESFYSVDGTSFDMYLCDGKRQEIYGTFPKQTESGVIWLSILYDDVKERELTSDEMKEIKMILDSILFS